jgi:hypothetical protein
MWWMNESGTLKITHKARVKFSVGNYIDIDVAPMSACHLLLGRPWQFDLDATHSGRSNNYSFVHKGVHHMLRPMPESVIKAAVFPPVKKTKQALKMSPNPRTTLFQEGENDVSICSPKHVASDSEISYKEANNFHVLIGSTSNILESEIIQDEDEIRIKSNMSEVLPVSCQTKFENIPKPRTALIRERENDEPMDHQGIPKRFDENCIKVIDNFTMQFGSFLCELKQNNMKRDVLATVNSVLPHMLVFQRN